jgi:hypothetical protein
MAEAGRSWYTELDFDSYVLDLLLFGWVGLCFVVILAVNAIVSAFGPLQKQPQERTRGEVGQSLTGAVLPIETTKWFNDAVSWFYLHYYYTPDLTGEWVKALNEQLLKLGGPVQANFDRIQSGSLPPRVTHVSCEASPQDRFIVHARLEARDLSFVVFASQQTHEGVKLTNVTANVLRLKGTLRVQSYREGGDVKVSFNFEGKPEIKVLVKPLNPYVDQNDLVDLGVVEANVRNSIILAKTTITVTHLLMPGNLNTVRRDFGDKGPGGDDSNKDRNLSGSSTQQNAQKPPAPGTNNSAPSQAGQAKPPQQQKPQEPQENEVLVAAVALAANPVTPSEAIPTQTLPVANTISEELNVKQQQEPVPVQEQVKTVVPAAQRKGVFQPVERQQNNSSLYSAPPKPPRMVGDKRLLVKVIKGNGLPVHEVGAANTVCMLSTDEPVQGFATSPVMNTQNPFWDEHFLFDITHETQEVFVEVYDQGKVGDEFLGEAIVYVEDLRKTPSSRQILKLRPPEGKFENHSGSVTVEFLFMDPSEADLLLDSMTTASNNQLSPRRRAEIARVVKSMAGQGSQNGHYDSGLNSSPNHFENRYNDESPRLSYSDSPYGMRQQQISTKGSSNEDLGPYPLNETYNQQQPITLRA